MTKNAARLNAKEEDERREALAVIAGDLGLDDVANHRGDHLDDEQGVVDPDREAQHQGERRRHLVHREEVRRGDGAAEPDPNPEHGPD